MRIIPCWLRISPTSWSALIMPGDRSNHASGLLMKLRTSSRPTVKKRPETAACLIEHPRSASPDTVRSPALVRTQVPLL